MSERKRWQTDPYLSRLKLFYRRSLKSRQDALDQMKKTSRYEQRIRSERAAEVHGMMVQRFKELIELYESRLDT